MMEDETEPYALAKRQAAELETTANSDIGAQSIIALLADKL